MSELQRWKITYPEDIFTYDKGEWVKASDALTIEQDRDALKAAAVEDKRRIAELEGRLVAANEGFGWWHSVNADDEQQEQGFAQLVKALKGASHD